MFIPTYYYLSNYYLSTSSINPTDHKSSISACLIPDEGFSAAVCEFQIGWQWLGLKEIIT